MAGSDEGCFTDWPVPRCCEQACCPSPAAAEGEATISRASVSSRFSVDAAFMLGWVIMAVLLSPMAQASEAIAIPQRTLDRTRLISVNSRAGYVSGTSQHSPFG